MKALQGKKTYISAAALIAIALGASWFGVIGHAEAAAMIVTACGLCGIRSGIGAGVAQLALQIEEQAKSGQKVVISAQSANELKQAIADEIRRQRATSPAIGGVGSSANTGGGD